MRAVVQRVTSSSVTVDGKIVGEIGKGLNVLIGVTHGDTEKDADYITDKVLGLRIFEDENEKMNLSLLNLAARGENVGVLGISQFTLYGDCRHGKRPAFTEAEAPDAAKALYDYCMEQFEKKSLPNIKIARGIFRADMQVVINNDGPVTLLLDSGKNF